MQNSSVRVERVIFGRKDEPCVGYLHCPQQQGSERLPVVLMGNGLAMEWHFGTADFVAAFTAAGMATLNFDYRHFGESAGTPRQLLDFSKQLDDWRSALAFLRTRDDIDATRIALWGSSLGGGHALMLAADEPALCAVVAQAPHLDSSQAMKAVPLWQILRTLGHALFDKLAAAFGAAPHCIPVAVEPGEVGLIGKPGWKAHYLSLVPPGSNWCNAVPARAIFALGNYNPIDVVNRVRMPVLLVYGQQDANVPAELLERARTCMPQATLYPFDNDHFAVYAGPAHATIIARETAFLEEQLAQ